MHNQNTHNQNTHRRKSNTLMLAKIYGTMGQIWTIQIPEWSIIQIPTAYIGVGVSGWWYTDNALWDFYV